MNIWQSVLISAARNKKIEQLMQNSRSASSIAKRFVGGENLDQAITVAKKLNDTKVDVSAFYLGEYVEDEELIFKTVQAKCNAIQKLAEAGLDVHVSVDPTQIGYMQSFDLFQKNAEYLAEKLKEYANSKTSRLMFDMEDASLNEPTMSVYRDLSRKGLPVALTLQAYLHRTDDDLEREIQPNAMIRLVRGAFAAGPEKALQGQARITDAYIEHARKMLKTSARNIGFYPVFATHDSAKIEPILELSKQNGWEKDQFEFEMLYGVRPDVQEGLIKRGYRLRLYLPFGQDWWAYAARRVGESPRNATLLLRSVLFSK